MMIIKGIIMFLGATLLGGLLVLMYSQKEIMMFFKKYWATLLGGGLLVLISWLLSLCWEGYTFAQIFSWVCTILGYVANLAIVTAIHKFFTKKTLDIKGYGKIRINRMRDNIQDLTNLISRDFHDGKTFERDSLLKAFYKDVQLDYIERSPTPPQEKRIELSANGKSLSMKRDSLKDVSQLISMARCLLNDGRELDNAMLKSIYEQWYKDDMIIS